MIVSASRRTDIPACYSRWFLRRLQAGEVFFPLRGGRVGRAALSPEWVDCIVFWTKNPAPMLPVLDEIARMGYRFYFEYTLTPYKAPIEGIRKDAGLFERLSDALGPRLVDWRYDPILFGGGVSAGWHFKQFEALCRRLHRYTTRCIVSFLDEYPHSGGFSGGGPEEMRAMARGLSEIAAAYGLPLLTCAEAADLSQYGIGHAACIDRAKIESILGCPIAAKKDPGQRPECGCVESVDVGAYDTCPAGCAYCYATTDRALARQRFAAHDPGAPMLTGRTPDGAAVSDRTSKSLRDPQLSLFTGG